jgi:hypothetical protein
LFTIAVQVVIGGVVCAVLHGLAGSPLKNVLPCGAPKTAAVTTEALPIENAIVAMST